MKKLKLSLYQLPVLLVAATFASPSYAQGNLAIEEIVVTATKRGAVSLQDTAGSIQAITAETLEKAQVEGFEDYIKMVPGLTSVSSGSGQSQIVIRGINSSRIIHSAAQFRSLAGLYMDEMPISLTGLNPDLGIVDVERVEVLRGPQGTLYGASSMSGTIRIITKQPDTKAFSGRAGADTSWTKDGDMNFGVKGSVNVPLSDRVAMRASAYYMDKGGYIDNVSPNSPEEDYNSEDVIGGRVVLAYYGDRLDASGTVMYNKLDADGRADEYQRSPGDGPVIVAALAPLTDELQTVKEFDDFFSNEFVAGNITLDYDFASVNLISTTSFFNTDVSNRLDDSIRVNTVLSFLGGGLINDFRNETDYETTIEEIRLSSTYESPLQWIVGGFYESNKKVFSQTAPSPGLNAILGLGPTDPLAGAAPNSVFDGTEDVDTTQLAVFGELTYSFTDAFRLTFGLRWFDYESDVSIAASGPANGGPTFVANTIEEDDVVPKVEVSFDISEDHMIYATYSEGFRLGGVNGFIPAATGVSCQDELDALGQSIAGGFGADTITSLEIGAKTSWLGGRVIANLAVYENEFDDIQTNFGLQCGFFQQINAGTLENTGVEAEFTFQISEELSGGFGFAYVDSEVTESVFGLNTVGDEAPYVPEFTASGSLEYSRPVSNGYSFIRGDIRYVGDSNNEFSSNPAVIQLDSYTIVDLTFGYDYNDWQFSVFARNVFDDEVVTNIDPDRVQPLQFTRGRPRTVGVSVTRNF